MNHLRLKALAGGLQGILELFQRLRRHRQLLGELVRRDLEDAYAGSVLASAWSVLHPLLLIGVYVFVFGYVFTARLGADMPEEPDFAVFMLSGLVVWLTVAAALPKGTSSLIASANLVKQVVFPVELLPIRSVIAAHAPMILGGVVLILYTLIRFQFVSPLILLAIYPIVAQMMLLSGICLFLSALAAFVRDTRDIVQVLMSFGIFLTPVIFLPGALPSWFKIILFCNPFSYAVWCMQDIFFFRSFEHPWAWAIVGPLGLVSLAIGYAFFRRVRPSLGDVL